MKKLLAVFLWQLLCLPSLAFSVNGKPKICTRDFNPWGNASVCSCHPGYAYKYMLGFCVKRDKWKPKEFKSEGVLKVVEGERKTKLFHIVVDGRVLELVLRLADKEWLKDFDGHRVSVNGNEVTLPSKVPSENMAPWVAVLVDEIEVLD